MEQVHRANGYRQTGSRLGDKELWQTPLAQDRDADLTELGMHFSFQRIIRGVMDKHKQNMWLCLLWTVARRAMVKRRQMWLVHIDSCASVRAEAHEMSSASTGG